jgi:hypothetical protein
VPGEKGWAQGRPRLTKKVYIVAAGTGTLTVNRNGTTSTVTISGPPNLHEVPATDESAAGQLDVRPVKGCRSFRSPAGSRAGHIALRQVKSRVRSRFQSEPSRCSSPTASASSRRCRHRAAPADLRGHLFRVATRSTELEQSVDERAAVKVLVFLEPVVKHIENGQQLFLGRATAQP